MADKIQNQLKEVGSKLENPPANKDALIKLLKQAAASLSELEQSPSKSVLESMQPFINAIVKPELLKHHDKEVKLLVATCTCEITRVTAPEAPYDDDVLKDIFHLIVSTFSGLRDTKGPSFGRRVTILDTVAKYRSCIVMLDLECDDLVNEMFRTFFAVASDEHSETVITSMKTIMVVLLEESEDINEDLLLIILSVLGRDKKGITTAARRLAMNVIGQCAGKLEPCIKQFIVQSMSGESSPLISQIDYHEVIYDVYRCAPQALAGIVPYLIGELLTDKIDLRLKAVKLVGDLFSIPGSSIPETFQPIFFEFLKRLTDRVVEVRMLVLEHVKLCMLSNPSRSEAPQLIAALCDRLLDYDESIRQKVVAVVSDIACHELSSISAETIKLVAERLRDRSLPVKKYTMERLSDIYRTCCLKHMASLPLNDDYDWIPGRLLRCFYDKDFRSDTVEHILCTSLFPAEFSVRDKVRNWVRLFSKFDKVEVKALEKILEQKQRLQLELQKYLSLKQMYKDTDPSELQKKVALCFRFMSHCFTDPTKAEADFQLLHHLKDANVWKILTLLLDPNTSSLQTWRSRDELLKIVGQKHPLYGFLSTLSMKCSYILFNKDHVKDILLEADLQKSSRNRLLTQSCMNILVILASFSPLLLCGTEKELVYLLEDDNEVIKEGVLHVLAKAGGTIREQLGESSSTLDLILERICVEGSRRQAKYAVHALAAITKDDGLKSLSVLYKRLVDMLEKKTHLPSVLQSLGCIAQTAMPVFETQESKIEGFIRKDILGCSENTSEKTKESWNDRSELCSLKIFGIKTLINSYLPIKDAHLRLGIDKLIKDLQHILSFGEISKDIISSSVDKAHLKLASAKAILRLSKHWDKNIPVDVFYLTLRTSEVGFPEVKKLFLNKVHQYIKDRSLDPKYACAFLLGLGSQQSVQEEKSEDHHNLSDIIQMCQQGKARQLSVQSDGNSLVVHPEYILPYLIHALAHHPSCPNIDECKDVKAYESIYRKLYLFLSMLALGEEDGKPGNSLKKEEVISVVSIIQSIRSSEDAVDTNMSKNSYAICDLCFSITKRLLQKQEDLKEAVVHVPLPEVLYKPHKKKEEKKEEEKVEKKEEEEKVEEKEERKAEEEKVTEGRTWLADASAFAHFESLNMDANDNVPSKIIEDDMLKDSETDGNEVPLGKMLKRLKAKGAKERKAVKNESTPAAAENDSNVDILGLVREMDLDNSGVLTKFDSINGHEKAKVDEKRKRKRLPKEPTNVSVPKRQRSSSAKSHKRSSFPRNGSKGLSAFDNIKMNDEPHSDSENKLFLGEHIEPVPADLEGGSADRGHIQTEEHGNTDGSNLEKPKKYMDTDGNQKSGSVKKRKRRSIAGLAKCTSKEGESHTTDLIGRRIKVWWPMDKEFYEGLVKSYDHQKRRHVVLYNDGDVEVLRLDKERWELVGETSKPTKRNRLSKSPRPKGGSSKKNTKSLDNAKEKYEEFTDIPPSSMVRGKRTPRKNLKQRRKGVFQRTLEYLEAERKEDPDMTEPEPESEPEHEHATFSKVDNLDTEEEASDREGGNSAGEQESDEEKQNKHAKHSFSDSDSSKEIEPDSGQKETENVERSGSDDEEEVKESPSATRENSTEEANRSSQATDHDRKSSEDSDEAEFSDDMPLGVWKTQVRKADESK
ncbi:sister chromatid cohesion protein PDS5 homolog A [Cynara cardunculus var. scolymus]|uniref:sister chromatid cohesion protein PDS5 homolog A n=1 Tax=Cynara cardunculus var. scolymus TaxID=59895 RepID=UPI000D62D54B|nr:sister chromatid cohesion protein PDS5 homolog A [Cynara cardunculus var. scolymus]